MATKKHTLKLVHGQDLHPAHVQRLVALNDEHKDAVERMLEERRRAFAAADASEDGGNTELPDGFSFPDNVLGFEFDPDNFRGKGKRGKNKGKNRQGGGGGGQGGRPAPSAQAVHAEVVRILTPLPKATNKGNLQIGEFNGQFLDKVLATRYQDSYIELLERFHVVLLEEVAKDGIDFLKQLVTGYGGVCSPENTRHQAVAIMWGPRMELVSGPTIYNSIATVQGIPDLRPAVRVDLRDKVTGAVYSFVVLHLKSMRGGPQVTSVVRAKQFALLVRDLGTDFEGLVGGDLNFPLDNPQFKEADPMYQAGFTLVASGDHSATQIIGSRIDGFFMKGITKGVDFYRVFAFFATLGRSFSDHGATKCEILVASKKSNQDPNQGGGATDDEDGGTDLPVIRLKRLTPAGKGRKRN